MIDSKSTNNRKTILVADDDHSILEVMNIILSDNGYEFIGITDGKKVLETTLLHTPKVILLDIWMSDQDGRNIVRSIRSNSKTQHIPVILVSANNETARIAKGCGADDFLAKPFNIEDLLTLVEKYCISPLSSNHKP